MHLKPISRELRKELYSREIGSGKRKAAVSSTKKEKKSTKDRGKENSRPIK